MRSTTAVRLNTHLRESPQDLANVLVRRAVRAQNERRTRRLRCRPAIYPSRLNPGTEIVFPLVRGRTVGLGGLEPPTSSLSAIMGLPLCNPAFLQVARIRNMRSNALFEGAAERRSRLAREVRPQGSRHSHSHAVLALKVPLTCTKPLPDQPIQHPIPRSAPPLLNLLTIRQQTHSP